MHAEPNARRKPFGRDQKRRQRRGDAFGFLARTIPTFGLT